MRMRMFALIIGSDELSLGSDWQTISALYYNAQWSRTLLAFRTTIRDTLRPCLPSHNTFIAFTSQTQLWPSSEGAF